MAMGDRRRSGDVMNLLEPLLHWLDVELWGPMWPNMFAPSAITLAAVAFTHIRSYRQRERLHGESTRQQELHHQEMKQHVTDMMRGAK